MLWFFGPVGPREDDDARLCHWVVGNLRGERVNGIRIAEQPSNNKTLALERLSKHFMPETPASARV